jgi:hypothetical protein
MCFSPTAIRKEFQLINRLALYLFTSSFFFLHAWPTFACFQRKLGKDSWKETVGQLEGACIGTLVRNGLRNNFGTSIIGKSPGSLLHESPCRRWAEHYKRQPVGQHIDISIWDSKDISWNWLCCMPKVRFFDDGSRYIFLMTSTKYISSLRSSFTGDTPISHGIPYAFSALSGAFFRVLGHLRGGLLRSRSSESLTHEEVSTPVAECDFMWSSSVDAPLHGIAGAHEIFPVAEYGAECSCFTTRRGR